VGDLNKTDSAPITQLTGSDSAGLETNTVKAYNNNNLATTDVIDAAGTNGEITVGTSPSIAKVGASNHVGRKIVRIYNSGNTTLAVGFKATTTVASGADMGETVFKRQTIIVNATAAVDIYVVSDLANGKAVITEG